MTMPELGTIGNVEGGMLAQIFVQLGDMSRQLAVMNERLSVLPDHENRLREHGAQLAAMPDPTVTEDRIRKLEQAGARLLGWAIGSGIFTGGSVGGIVGLLTGQHHP